MQGRIDKDNELLQRAMREDAEDLGLAADDEMPWWLSALLVIGAYLGFAVAMYAFALVVIWLVIEVGL